MKKKIVASGLAVGLVAGAGAGLILQSSGFAGASNTSSSANVATVSTDPSGSTDTTVAGTDDTGTDADRPDPSTRITEILQPLVDDGTLTADQLSAVVDALAAAGPIGGGHGGPGGRGGPGGDHGGRGGLGLDAAATALGITADELRTELEGGSTLADVAAAKGVDVQTVIDALVAEAKAHVDDEVASGEITQAEADTKLADATTRITDAVNNGFPQRGDHHGPDDDGDGPDATVTTTAGA